MGRACRDLGTAGIGVGIWQEYRGSSRAGLSWQLSVEEACHSCPALCLVQSVPDLCPLCFQSYAHPVLSTACGLCLESNGDSALHLSIKDLITDF